MGEKIKMVTVHKRISKKNKWFYLCDKNKPIRTKNINISWKYVTCKNCLKLKLKKLMKKEKVTK